MRKLLVFVLVLVLPVASGGVPVDTVVGQGSSHYVDNEAAGNNDGTSWADAWQGFSDIDWGSVHPGDTIYISGGSGSKTYTETLTIGASGIDGDPITIRPGAAHPTQSSGHDGWVVVGSGAMNGIHYGSSDYVTVDGSDGAGNIRMRVTNTTRDGVYASGSTGIKLLYVHVYRCGDSANDDNVEFSDCSGGSEIAYCDIQDPWQDAVKVGSGELAFGGLSVHDNWIHGMVDDGISGGGGMDVYDNVIGPWGDWSSASGHPDGMQLYEGYHRIYDNLFYSDYWPGGSNALLFLNYAFGGYGQEQNHVYVYNNVFITSGETYTGAHFYGIAVAAQGGAGNEDMDDIRIMHNTFVDVGYTSISVSARDPDAVFTSFIVKNNLIYNCRHTGGSGGLGFSGFDFDNSDVDFDYNLTHAGDDGRDGIGWDGVTYTVAEFNSAFGKNNVNAAPDFVSYSVAAGLGNDLRLSSLDVNARDAGADLSEFQFLSFDKNGIQRPQGLGWDIGAYEFVPDLYLRGAPGDQTIYLDWTVNATLPSTATWHIDYYTTTATTPFTATDPFSTTRAYTLTDHVINYEWYTVTLHAMVDSTSWLSDTVRVMPTDILVYLPIVLKED